MSLFFQDDWRQSAKLTLNLGVRYELILPFIEAGGHMVNLDVPPDFTGRGAGAVGPDGRRSRAASPPRLVNPDINNVAPRVGAAWRIKPGTILRGGYGISFNAGLVLGDRAPARRSSRRSRSPSTAIGTAVGAAAR